MQHNTWQILCVIAQTKKDSYLCIMEYNQNVLLFIDYELCNSQVTIANLQVGQLRKKWSKEFGERLCYITLPE